MRFVLMTAAAKAGPKSVLRLDKEKVSHLCRVLRLEWDESVCVVDGSGRLFIGMLEEGDGGGQVRLRELVRTEAAPEPLELVIGFSKNATMDWVVEKAVECGVTAIRPVCTARSVVKVDPNESAKYLRRWQAIVDGAVEQSERLWRPEVFAPVAWQKFIGEKTASNTFAFLSELRHKPGTEKEAVSETWSKLKESSGQPVRVLIGPEGGFDDTEREQMVQCNFRPVSLGNTVLRVETAVISALTLARTARLISPG